jgi:hypothetical protein
MRKVLYFALSAIFLAAGSAAFGADFWENKPYDTWSQKECNKLLTDSPWASDDLTLIAEGINQATTGDDGLQLTLKYQVQFRSALPVRQAVVRQMQLAQKYDTLAPEQKQQFDQSANTFLSADFSDVVVVYVTYQLNSQDKSRQIDRHWQTQTMDLLKNTVFLRNPRGEQVALAKFIAPQGAERSFQFIFPREIDGKPFITHEDKSLQLEFSYPVISGLGNGRGFLEFKPKKMIFQGNVAY